MNPFAKRLALATVAAAALATAATEAFAQAPATQARAERPFDVPAAPLSRSVLVLSEQAGVQVVFEAGAASDTRGQAVRGRMTFEAAIGQLLQGTGLTWRWIRPGVATIERDARAQIDADGSRVLGPVMVEGVQGTLGAGMAATRGEGVARVGGERGAQDAEAEGYRPYVASIGAGAPTPIEDIPRSISVLTQEQIEKQDITTIADALQRLPGISVVERGSNDNAVQTGAGVYARGFQITQVQIDGGAPQRLDVISNGLMDMGAYERVEVVRGANGTFIGANSPGGSLNLVRKRPGVLESFDVSLLTGSFDRYRGSVDYSTPSLGGTAIAFRGVVTVEDQGFWYNNASRASTLLYGIFDAPLGDGARIEAGYRYSDIAERGGYKGVPRYGDGPLIDFPDFHYNPWPDWIRSDVANGEMFGRLFVDLGGSWNLEIGTDYTTLDHASIDFFTNRISLLSSGVLYPGAESRSGVLVDKRSADSRQTGVDVKLTGRVETFGLVHNLYLAADYNTEINEYRVTSPPAGPDVLFMRVLSLSDLLSPWPTPDFADQPYLVWLGNTWNQGTTVSDVISWRDRVDLTLAARRYASGSFTQSIYTAYGFSADPSQAYQPPTIPARWMPSYAISFRPLDRLTLYASLSEGAKPQDQYYTREGNPLDPALFENKEIGIKYGADTWLATLSAYRYVNRNVASSIPGSSGQCLPGASTCYSAEGDTIESEGFDVEFTGEVLPGLAVLASYNYNANEVTSANRPYFTQSPASEAKLSLDWTPGFFPRTSVQLTASWRDEIYQAGRNYTYDPVSGQLLGWVDYNFTSPAHTVLDFGVDHAISDQFSLRAYVENVTDEEYYSSVSTSTGTFPGAPRSFMVSLRWRDENENGSVGGPIFAAPFGEPADWYGVLDAGLHRMDVDLRSRGPGSAGEPVSWRVGADEQAAVTGRLGYRLSPQWRAELEGGYRRAGIESLRGDGAAPNGVCSVVFAGKGVPPDCSRSGGEFDNLSLIVNAIRDFGEEHARLRSFVGAGLGLSRSTIAFGGKMDGLDDPGLMPWQQYTSNELIFANGVSLGLAWQGLAGISYALSERATVDLTYRYYRAPGVEVDARNSDVLTPSLEGFRGDYSNHAVAIGYRWAFGARN